MVMASGIGAPAARAASSHVDSCRTGVSVQVYGIQPPSLAPPRPVSDIDLGRYAAKQRSAALLTVTFGHVRDGIGTVRPPDSRSAALPCFGTLGLRTAESGGTYIKAAAPAPTSGLGGPGRRAPGPLSAGPLLPN